MLETLNITQKQKLLKNVKPFILKEGKCIEWDKTTNCANV
jgi:hypothetical protein